MEPLAEHDPQVIGGFRLLGRLGQGGMGRVFVGTSGSGRYAAVKILRDDVGVRDSDRVKRFKREIEAARNISGAFTAPLLGSGPDDDPPWLATELRGPTLAEVVRTLGPLSPAVTWRLAAGLAEVLQNVHDRGVIHRDLKPANILLDSEGVKVIDFGISRIPGSTITHVGNIMGTYAFMSPEQARGGKVRPSSDVFSLGCVIAFVATGVSPFGEPQSAGMAVRSLQNGPDLDHIPDELLSLVRECLAPDPKDRPAPEDLVREAKAGLDRCQPVATPSYWPEPVASWILSWRQDLLRSGSEDSDCPQTQPFDPVADDSVTGRRVPPGGSPTLRGDGPPGPRAARNPVAAERAADGDLLRAQRRYQAAADAYRDSLQLDGEDAEVNNDLGRVLYELNQLTEAETCFRRAISLAPGYAAALHNLCVVLHADERYAAAEETSRQLITAAPGDPAGYEDLGDSLYYGERYPDAVEAYRQASARDPGNPRIAGKLKSARKGG